MTSKTPNPQRRRKRKKAGDNAQSPENVDCLLDLPDAVLHQILLRVSTTEMFRMSVLSKAWRRVCFKLPGLFFTDSGFFPNTFCRNVRRSMALRRKDILGETANPILSFKLELKHTWRWNSVEKWLKLISNAKLNELDLHFQPRNNTKYYRLPPSLLQNATALTRIRLFGFNAKGFDSASLQNLSSLSLKLVSLSDPDLQSLLNNCIALENLCLHTCTGLKNPNISSPRLKFLEIGQSSEREKFGVDAPNLESFVCENLVTDSSLSLSVSVTNLVFISSIFDDLWLEDLICSLPRLESLTLLGCNRMQNVKLNIRGPSLTRFTFHGNGNGGKALAKVDSPSLVYFSFQGKLQPGFTMNPRNLSKANIRLYNSQTEVDELYPVLLKFLTSLNCSDSLTIDLRSEKVLSFPQELSEKSESPLPKLKHMKITTKASPSNDPEFKKILDWVSPLRTLSVTKRY